MKPQFQYPIEPFAETQGWGTYDPLDYSQFGFTRHNGLDMVLSPDKHIVSPCNGTVVRVATKENGLWQPNGGGVFVGIVSDPFDFPDFTNTTPDNVTVHFAAGTHNTLIDLLHLESIVVKEGDRVTAGQLVAIGDNTGFSTGPHCHSQWRRITWNGGTNYATVDVNDANDSFDPTQLFLPSPPQPAFVFTKNLQVGMTDPDVQKLQTLLNKNPQTVVASAGLGSIGKETTYFGSLTLNAVIRFQTLHGIKPNVGYVGPITRGVLNTI